MTAEEMWRQLQERHPSLQDPNSTITLKSRGLKALIDQAYSEGHGNGRKWEKSLTDKEPKSSDDWQEYFFKSIFGGKK